MSSLLITLIVLESITSVCDRPFTCKPYPYPYPYSYSGQRDKGRRGYLGSGPSSILVEYSGWYRQMGPEDKGRFYLEYLILVEWWADERMIGLDSRILAERICTSGDLSLNISSLFWSAIFSSAPYTSSPNLMKDSCGWCCILSRQEPTYIIGDGRHRQQSGGDVILLLRLDPRTRKWHIMQVYYQL